MNDSERALLRNLQTHDLAEHLRLRRAKLAREAGLPAEEFAQPFPGCHSTTVIRTEGLGWAGKLLVGAAALGLFGGAGLGLTRLLPDPAVPPRPEPIELRVRWWVEDGTVKTQVEPP